METIIPVMAPTGCLPRPSVTTGSRCDGQFTQASFTRCPAGSTIHRDDVDSVTAAAGSPCPARTTASKRHRPARRVDDTSHMACVRCGAARRGAAGESLFATASRTEFGIPPNSRAKKAEQAQFPPPSPTNNPTQTNWPAPRRRPGRPRPAAAPPATPRVRATRCSAAASPSPSSDGSSGPAGGRSFCARPVDVGDEAASSSVAAGSDLSAPCLSVRIRCCRHDMAPSIAGLSQCHRAMVRIEERDPNAIGGQGRTAVMERQHCSKGKGKVLGDDGGSYSGGATDVMRSKTGTEVHLRRPTREPSSHGDKWKNNGFICA
ncbi:uncharacterized protein LOC110434824 [Sorghum bicolor]|uniref:uncharacterized protein LOC110434824 n=1 Tax=Sorghum bicolor TaxID=4558 RepID=UPI000B425E9C|nr:uncharacterized protein LOC110434824 [Sorghum bicolor]|eukprot:XP_021315236.1 uncharacterized protein LOC110434824 [Sorghum bicolor]